MRGIGRLRLVAAAAALLVGAGVATFVSASPAVAYYSPPLFLDVRVNTPAYLTAGGAAVQVPVEVICTGRSASVELTVTQSTPTGVASGMDYADVGCNNGWQRFLLTVSASPSGSAFTRGSAVAEARVSGCAGDYYGQCGSERNQATIKLRN